MTGPPPGRHGQSAPPSYGATAVPPVPALPPLGWYPDPAGGSSWRWWDGTGWTGHTAPRREGGSPSAPPWMQVHGTVVDRETRLAPLAAVSVVVVAAIGLLYGFLPIAYSSDLAALYHWFRLAFEATSAVPRRTPPPYPVVAVGYVRLVYAGDLVYTAVGVVFLMWQYRAADAARRLGLPADHRPGWGVAFWFIPIANLWCPYQALRDCLPPGHPRRRTALWCWLAYLAAVVAAAAVFATAPYHRPVAVAGVVLEGLLLASVAANGVRLIRAIGRSHRDLVGR